jgi:hypothetical protein
MVGPIPRKQIFKKVLSVMSSQVVLAATYLSNIAIE